MRLDCKRRGCGHSLSLSGVLILKALTNASRPEPPGQRWLFNFEPELTVPHALPQLKGEISTGSRDLALDIRLRIVASFVANQVREATDEYYGTGDCSS